ncbi:MAG: phosphotransferase [Candidatus Omnitrophica bacterium]|nr:phosphotransferase [Candidatus Omnitrophota bacterium]
MPVNYSPDDIFGGVDNLSLDKRIFDPSRDDIKRICRFFSIGKLRHYKKEKGIIVSHSNFFVFASTTHGQYALKFYPPDSAKSIAIEYAANRLLAGHHFLTPTMHEGLFGRPFTPSNGRLAACYSYIDGRPVCQRIKQQNIFPKINAAMLSLKTILSAHPRSLSFPKQESLAATINILTQNSRALAPYEQKETIEGSLIDACQTYQLHQPLFTRQKLHNNANLTNFLIYKETVYTLDLSHIREDYVLSDLASLVISCLFFNIPAKTTNNIVKNYFLRHQIKQEYFPVLNTLVKIGLVKEYLKNIRREKSIGLFPYPQGLVRTYTSHLLKRKKSIAAALKNEQCPKLIV